MCPPGMPANLVAEDAVWTDSAPQLYAQAAAAQWDPATAIPWDTPMQHEDVVEDANGRERLHGRGAGPALEKSHLADEGARLQEVEDLLAPVLGELRHLHATLADLV